MTRDNAGRTDGSWRPGEPGKALEPADVVGCRECGGLVRRVNNQHLRSDRCRLIRPDKGTEEDNLRSDHPTTVAGYREKHPDAPVMAPRERLKLSEANADPEVDERRRELVKSRWQGEDMGSIVGRLSERYGVSENAVWRDWTRREEWLPRVFGIDDAHTAVMEAIARHGDVLDRLDRLARRAESQSEVEEARRVYKEVAKATKDQADLLLSATERMGEAGAPQSASLRVSGRIEHEHRNSRGAPGEELDDETLREVDDLTGGEVVDAEFRDIQEDDNMNDDTQTEDSG